MFKTSFCLFLSLVVGPVLMSCSMVGQREDYGAREPASDKRREKQKENFFNKIHRALGADPTQIFLKYQQKVESPDSPAVSLPSLYTQNFSQTEFETCITEMCGPAASNWGAHNVTSRPGLLNHSVKAVAYWRQNFGNPVALNLKNRIRAQKMAADRVAQLLDRKVKLRPGHPLQALNSFIKLLSEKNVDIHRVFSISQDGRSLVIDESKFKEVTASFSDSERRVYRLFAKNLETLYLNMGRAFGLHFMSPLASRLALRFPDLPVAEALRKDAQTLRQKLENLRTELGESALHILIDNFLITLIERAIRGEDLLSHEVDLYVKEAQSLEQWALILLPGEFRESLLALPFDGEAEIQKLTKDDISERLKRQANDWENRLADELKNIEDTCASRLAASTDLNASSLRLKKSLEMVQAVKSASKTVASEFVGPMSRPAIQEAIDKVEFLLPPSNEVLVSRLWAAKEADERQIQNEFRTGLLKGEDGEQLILLLMMFLNDKSDLDTVLQFGRPKILTACESLPIRTVSDYALSSFGKVSMSWYAANYPEMGAAIVAHEIGHLVSANLRTSYSIRDEGKTFFANRSCVAHRNPFFVEPKTFNSNEDTLWVEEDWADHFSARVMNELEKQNSAWASERNMGCALVKNSAGHYEVNTLSPYINDTHSSDILRLLLVGYDRGRLADSCQRFLNYGRPLRCE